MGLFGSLGLTEGKQIMPRFGLPESFGEPRRMYGEHREEIPVHWNLPARAGRTLSFAYCEHLPLKIDLSPGDGSNFTRAHAGQERDSDERRECL